MKPYAIFTPPGTVPAVHAASYWTPWHLAGLAAVLAFFAVALVIALLTMIQDWKERQPDA